MDEIIDQLRPKAHMLWHETRFALDVCKGFLADCYREGFSSEHFLATLSRLSQFHAITLSMLFYFTYQIIFIIPAVLSTLLFIFVLFLGKLANSFFLFVYDPLRVVAWARANFNLLLAYASLLILAWRMTGGVWGVITQFFEPPRSDPSSRSPSSRSPSSRSPSSRSPSRDPPRSCTESHNPLKNCAESHSSLRSPTESHNSGFHIRKPPGAGYVKLSETALRSRNQGPPTFKAPSSPDLDQDKNIPDAQPLPQSARSARCGRPAEDCQHREQLCRELEQMDYKHDKEWRHKYTMIKNSEITKTNEIAELKKQMKELEKDNELATNNSVRRLTGQLQQLEQYARELQVHLGIPEDKVNDVLADSRTAEDQLTSERLLQAELNAKLLDIDTLYNKLAAQKEHSKAEMKTMTHAWKNRDDEKTKQIVELEARVKNLRSMLDQEAHKLRLAQGQVLEYKNKYLEASQSQAHMFHRVEHTQQHSNSVFERLKKTEDKAHKLEALLADHNIKYDVGGEEE